MTTMTGLDSIKPIKLEDTYNEEDISTPPNKWGYGGCLTPGGPPGRTFPALHI